MSDLLKNLKSIFVTEETKSGSNQANTQKEEPAKEKSPKSAPVSYPAGDLTGKVNQKFTKVLLEAIEKHNQEGFDYLEYKNSLQSLAKMDMDEATKFKSAFAMAQTMGADPAKLVSSAKFYKEILSKEKSKFDQAASIQMNSKVEGKKKEVKAMEADIAKKKKQIETLNKEIISLEGKLKKTMGSVDNEAQKIKQTQLDFVASYKNLDGQIAADIEKMTKYLK